MSNGQEAKDLRNFAGILRPGDSGALDEGRLGSLGRGQQSLSPGRGQAERGSGRRGSDHGEAGRRSQTPRGVRRALRRTRRTAEEPRPGWTEGRGCPQAISQGEEISGPTGQGGGSEGRSSVRTGEATPRA